MFITRWINPPWTNTLAPSRQNSWRRINRAPSLAPQPTSCDAVGHSTGTPAAVIAANHAPHARTISGVTTARRVASSRARRKASRSAGDIRPGSGATPPRRRGPSAGRPHARISRPPASPPPPCLDRQSPTPRTESRVANAARRLANPPDRRDRPARTTVRHYTPLTDYVLINSRATNAVKRRTARRRNPIAASWHLDFVHPRSVISRSSFARAGRSVSGHVGSCLDVVLGFSRRPWPRVVPRADADQPP